MNRNVAASTTHANGGLAQVVAEFGGHGVSAAFDPLQKLNRLIGTYGGDFAGIDAEVCNHEAQLTRELQGLVFTHSSMLLSIFSAIKLSIDEVQTLKRTVAQTKAVIGEINSTSYTSSVLAEALEGADERRSVGVTQRTQILTKSPFKHTNMRPARLAALSGCRSRLLSTSHSDCGQWSLSGVSRHRVELATAVIKQRRQAAVASAVALRRNVGEVQVMFDTLLSGAGDWQQRRDARMSLVRAAGQEIDAGNLRDALSLVQSLRADEEALGYTPELLQVEALLQVWLRWTATDALPPHIQPAVAPQLLKMLSTVASGTHDIRSASSICEIYLKIRSRMMEQSLLQIVASADRHSLAQEAARAMVSLIDASLEEQSVTSSAQGGGGGRDVDAAVLASLARWIAACISRLGEKIVSPHLRTIANSAIVVVSQLSETALSAESCFLLRAAKAFPDKNCLPLLTVVSDAIATCELLLPLEHRGFPNSAAKLVRSIIKGVLIPALNRSVGVAQEAADAWSSRCNRASSVIAVTEALRTGEVPDVALQQLLQTPHGPLASDFADALYQTHEVIRASAQSLASVSAPSPTISRLVSTIFPSHHFSHLPTEDVVRRRGADVSSSFSSKAVALQLVRRLVQQGQKFSPVISPWCAQMLGSVSGVCALVMHLTHEVAPGKDIRRATVARAFIEDAHFAEVLDTSLQQLFRAWFMSLDDISAHMISSLQCSLSNAHQQTIPQVKTLADFLDNSHTEERLLVLGVINALLLDVLCAAHTLDVVHEFCGVLLPDSPHLDALHRRSHMLVSSIVRQTYLAIDDHQDDTSSDDDEDDEPEMNFVSSLVRLPYVAPPSARAMAEQSEFSRSLLASVVSRYPPFRFDEVDLHDEGSLFHFVVQISLNVVSFVQHAMLPPIAGLQNGSDAEFAQVALASAFGGASAIPTNTPSYLLEGLVSTTRPSASERRCPPAGLTLAICVAREAVIVMCEKFFCVEEYWTTMYGAVLAKAEARGRAGTNHAIPLTASMCRQIVLFLALLTEVWKPLFLQDGGVLERMITGFLAATSIPGTAQPLQSWFAEPSMSKKVAKLMNVNIATFASYTTLADAADADEAATPTVSFSLLNLCAFVHAVTI